jgi:hypothetical protein
MNIQEWLAHLLARPDADPLDWESYAVTMGDATWKGLWRDIDATQAYEDGLEVGLRLLHATQQHRGQLGERGYRAHQILLYRSILGMLDKADRWDVYLTAWESIRAHTSHCLPARGDNLTVNDLQLESFVRRDDGGFGVPPLPYGTSPPKTIAVHFLYPQIHRKTLIERKLAQERAGKRFAQRRPLGRGALTAEKVQSRLAEIREPARRDETERR